MVSGYPTSTIIPQVDGLSMDTPVLGRHNICGSKPQIPDGMSNPSVPLTAKFFANPRCPLGASAAAPALDPIAVSGEERSENSPIAVGEEAVLPTDLPDE